MAGEDPTYASWVRHQPCCAPGCEVRVAGTIHHPRIGLGMGQRGHDHTGVALCGSGTTGCHGSIGNIFQRGPFRGWSRGRRQAWERGMAITLRERYHRQMAHAAQDAVWDDVF